MTERHAVSQRTLYTAYPHSCVPEGVGPAPRAGPRVPQRHTLREPSGGTASHSIGLTFPSSVGSMCLVRQNRPLPSGTSTLTGVSC